MRDGVLISLIIYGLDTIPMPALWFTCFTLLYKQYHAILPTHFSSLQKKARFETWLYLFDMAFRIP